MPSEIQEKKLNLGEFTYNEQEKLLMDLKKGQEIGDILKKFTVCPAGDPNCIDSSKIVITGYDPKRKMKRTTETILCPFGMSSPKYCPLRYDL
jgi:hypothetical protein